MGLKMMIIPAVSVVVMLLALTETTEGLIGMNWGRVSAQRLLPAQVVDLMLQNGIGYARVYTSEPDILQAFAGSEIDLTVTISTTTLFTSVDAAKSWVLWKANNLTQANVSRVILGDMIFNRNRQFILDSLRSMQNLQNALFDSGYGDIKVNTEHNINVLKKNIIRPSEAEFLHEIKEEMITFLRFLKTTNSPFLLQTFPISDTAVFNFDISFAFPDNKTTHAVSDINGAIYTNMFEFTFDSFVWALEKMGAPDIPIVVSQIGWPTDGYPGASATSAERFYSALLPWVASNRGTLKRPGAPINIYLHSLTDEPRMKYIDGYAFMRHWGIYRSNGQPKYKIDLSGKGRDVFPTEVRGIQRMPQRWCLYKGNGTDMAVVEQQREYACEVGDCTSLLEGGSCSKLSFEQNLSYAFNSMFQFSFQDEKACEFEGLAHVTAKNPSVAGCVFPVEVVRGEKQSIMPLVRHPPASFGQPLYLHSSNSAMFLGLLLSIFATLIWD